MKADEALEVLRDELSQCVKGERWIVVLDRGWIFVGNLSEEDNGDYVLTHCSNVRRWNKGGFGLLTKSAKEAEATLDKCNPIKFNVSRMIFRSPIKDGWDE